MSKKLNAWTIGEKLFVSYNIPLINVEMPNVKNKQKLYETLFDKVPKVADRTGPWTVVASSSSDEWDEANSRVLSPSELPSSSEFDLFLRLWSFLSTSSPYFTVKMYKIPV